MLYIWGEADDEQQAARTDEDQLSEDSDDERPIAKFRVFYAFRIVQCLTCFVSIVWLVMTMSLCGSSSMDQIVVKNNGSCSNVVNSVPHSNSFGVKEGEGTIDTMNCNLSDPNGVCYGDDQKEFSSRLNEGFSCINLRFTDLICLGAGNGSERVACRALNGLILIPAALLLEIVFLIISFKFEVEQIMPPEKSTIRWMTVKHFVTSGFCMLWLSSIILTWNERWEPYSFLPELPHGWILAWVAIYMLIISFFAELAMTSSMYSKVVICRPYWPDEPYGEDGSTSEQVRMPQFDFDGDAEGARGTV